MHLIQLFANQWYNSLEVPRNSKYLMFAFGEIILVVIGILIAIILNLDGVYLDESIYLLHLLAEEYPNSK